MDKESELENTYLINDNYIYPDVDNIEDKSEIYEQEKILNKTKQKKMGVSKTSDEEIEPPFDPYKAFVRRRGLNTFENKMRLNTYYLNVDSSLREKIATSTTDDQYILNSNAMTMYTTTKNTLAIVIPNNSLEVGGIVAITGLTKTELHFNLKTINLIPPSEVYQIEFTNGSQYVKIKYNPNMYVPMQAPTVSSGAITQFLHQKNLTLLQTLPTNLYIDLSGFVGYPDMTKFHNIPINILNGVHQIYFYNPDNNVTYNESVGLITGSVTLSDQFYPYSNNGSTVQNYFFIKLPFAFSYTGSVTPTGYNNKINIIFKHIGGVPYNYINANYPVGEEYAIGYHTILGKTTNGITVDLQYTPYYSLYTAVGVSTPISFGNENIIIANITNINQNYTDANHFKLTLGDTYNNIVKVELVSSIFPNSNYVFNSSNSKLYWQNLDDGGLYSITIDYGNYTYSELITEVESKIYATQKVVSDSHGIYTQNNYIKMSINTKTNLVKFQAYKEGYLNLPITGIDPPILPDIIQNGSTYTLTINHPYHGFTSQDIGTNIIFSNFVETNGISASNLNGTHAIVSIIDSNSYTIQLTHINIGSEKTNTRGGNAVLIYVPTKIRIFFSYSDTMGEELGFRKIGYSDSITPFYTTITNQGGYMYETQTTYASDAVNLIGNSYVLLCCTELSNITQVGKITTINNIFSKINLFSDATKSLSGGDTKLLYDSFVYTPIYYNDPIYISELNIDVYDPDGNLYDFKGLDFSFVLKLTVIDETPKGTSINSGSGREY